MNRWNSQRYLYLGQAAGVPDAVLDNAVATAEATRRVNPRLPPILTLNHLAQQAGVPYAFLRRVTARTSDDLYKVFKLSKRNVGHARGRFRYICVPHPLLLRTQRWISNNVLREVVPHDASSAYHPGSRIRDAAQIHCRCRWLIKLDITNFFESLLETDVYDVFRTMGYQPLVAFELSRICTRLRIKKNPSRGESQQYSLQVYNSGALGHLPQGAPTSPMLANLASSSLDKGLTELASEFGLAYTRYADDLTFSTRSPSFSRRVAHEFISRSYSILRQHSLWPNRAKMKIIPPGARKVVLGLVVNETAPRLSREFKDKLRMHIYFLTHRNIGPVHHADRLGFDSVIGLQHHVYGLAAFAAGIEPDWGFRQMAELGNVGWPATSRFP